MKSRLTVLFLAVFLVLLDQGPVFAKAQDGFEKLGLVPEPDPYPAPRFSSSRLNGKPLGTEEVKGKLVLLNFWATWCPPCRFEMPSMDRLYKEFKGDGLEIVAVNFMESAEKARSFMKESGFTFPVVTDTSGEIADRYGVRAIPITFLIGRKGNLLAKSMGYKDWHTDKMRDFFRTIVRDGAAFSTAAGSGAVHGSRSAGVSARWLLWGAGGLLLVIAAGFFLWPRKPRPPIEL